MSIEEAKQILLQNRPERPRAANRRRLLKAIDIIIEELDRKETEK